MESHLEKESIIQKPILRKVSFHAINKYFQKQSILASKISRSIPKIEEFLQENASAYIKNETRNIHIEVDKKAHQEQEKISSCLIDFSDIPNIDSLQKDKKFFQTEWKDISQIKKPKFKIKSTDSIRKKEKPIKNKDSILFLEGLSKKENNKNKSCSIMQLQHLKKEKLTKNKDSILSLEGLSKKENNKKKASIMQIQHLKKEKLTKNKDSILFLEGLSKKENNKKKASIMQIQHLKKEKLTKNKDSILSLEGLSKKEKLTKNKDSILPLEGLPKKEKLTKNKDSILPLEGLPKEEKLTKNKDSILPLEGLSKEEKLTKNKDSILPLEGLPKQEKLTTNKDSILPLEGLPKQEKLTKNKDSILPLEGLPKEEKLTKNKDSILPLEGLPKEEKLTTNKDSILPLEGLSKKEKPTTNKDTVLLLEDVQIEKKKKNNIIQREKSTIERKNILDPKKNLSRGKIFTPELSKFSQKVIQHKIENKKEEKPSIQKNHETLSTKKKELELDTLLKKNLIKEKLPKEISNKKTISKKEVFSLNNERQRKLEKLQKELKEIIPSSYSSEDMKYLNSLYSKKELNKNSFEYIEKKLLAHSQANALAISIWHKFEGVYKIILERKLQNTQLVENISFLENEMSLNKDVQTWEEENFSEDDNRKKRFGKLFFTQFKTIHILHFSVINDKPVYLLLFYQQKNDFHKNSEKLLSINNAKLLKDTIIKLQEFREQLWYKSHPIQKLDNASNEAIIWMQHLSKNYNQIFYVLHFKIYNISEKSREKLFHKLSKEINNQEKLFLTSNSRIMLILHKTSPNKIIDTTKKLCKESESIAYTRLKKFPKNGQNYYQYLKPFL